MAARARRHVSQTRRFRAVALASVVSLVLGLSDVPLLSTAVPAQAAPSAKPSCPDSRPDRLSAASAARWCGSRVEVLGELSETARVWAEPNGSLTAEQSLGIARFRRDGAWVDVDLTLARARDGSVAPRAHPADLRLSSGAAGGGVHELASLGAGAERMTLGFTGRLPDPVLDGTKATYPEVRPAIDLVVEVTRYGYEQSLIVKERAGLASVQAALRALAPAGPGARSDDAGGVLFTDQAGKVIGHSPAPLMWDAATDPGRAAEQTGSRQLGVAIGEAAGAGGRRQIALTADQAWLADPQRRFPITIDPYEGKIGSFDTYVASGTTSDLSTSTKLAIGTQNSGATKRIAYVNLSARGLARSKINYATLKLWGTAASSCANGTWMVFGTVSNAHHLTRWSNRPSLLDRHGNDVGQDGTGDAPFGSSITPSSGGCTGQWVDADATALFQHAANRNWWEFTAALAPYWDDTNTYYKEFKSLDSGTLPHAMVNWNEPPTVANPVSSPALTGCTTTEPLPYMTSRTPRLSVTANDSDGASSNVNFEWWVHNGAKIGGTAVTGVPAGSAGSASVPDGALADGGRYAWRAQAVDPAGDPVGDWSPWCSFVVDVTKPGAPTVTSKDGKYPSTGADNTWGHGGFAQSGVFTISPVAPSGDLASVSYQLDTDQTATTVTATGQVDVTVTPSEDGVRTLTVTAKDKAGNQSETVTYVFNVGRAGLSEPRQGANVVKSTKIAISGDATYAKVRFGYRRGPGAVDQDIPRANLTTASGGGVTADLIPIAELGGHAVWNAVDTLGLVGGVAQIRAMLYPSNGVATDGLIRNALSGRCLNASGSGPYPNGTDIILWDCTGTDNEKFELTPDGLIRNPVSNRCLNIWGGAPYVNGQAIKLHDCVPTAENEKFHRTPDGLIRNTASGKCLNISGAGPYPNGNTIILWDCDGAAGNEQFSELDTGYSTQWVTVNVDPNGDGAASTQLGPGAVNLLTGDHTLSATDADEFGLSVSRTASSRDVLHGWLPQGERLTANQQQISSDTSGFDASPGSTVARVTHRGQGSTSDSLSSAPGPTGSGNDTYVSLGGDLGGLRLGMRGGRRYRVTGWIHVPSGTGLTSDHPSRGLRIMAFARAGSDPFTEAASAPASFTDGWQQLSVDLVVPEGATEAAVRLYNGFTLGRTDKVVGWDNLSVRELVAPFGPQWRGGPADAVSGLDYTGLDFPSADVAAVTLAAGGQVTFGKSANGSFFAEPGAETLTLTSVDLTRYRLTDIDGTVVEFAQQAASTKFVVTGTWDAGAQASSTTRYVYDLTDNRALVKRVIAPVEPGVGDCAVPVPAKGCQVLEYEYATVTTATATAFGDVRDQVRAVRMWSWNPEASAVDAVEVARYTYDDHGRLREEHDPRLSTPLKVVYAYDSAGHVTTLTPAGQLPWTFDHGDIAADPNTGRLHRVRRASLVPGSKTETGPENATRVVYRVPLDRAAGGPHDLDAVTAAAWGQTDVPTDATAVFGPQDDPLVVQASAGTPGRDGYGYATVHYLNPSGQEVNKATTAATGVSGGNIDTVQYDRYGHDVWSLEAANRLLALGTSPDAAAVLTDLGLSTLDTKSRAGMLASTSTYAPDGTDLIGKVGPTVRTVLEAPFEGRAAGSVVVGRPRTVFRYDEGKPDGAVHHLVTTEAAGLSVNGAATGAGDADVRVTTTGYDPVNGAASGWVLKKPTRVTKDGAATFSVHDASGRLISSWGPGSDGTDAGTRQTIHFTAGDNPADAACGGHPEWAGEVCLTKAAGAVTGHDASRAPGTLVVRRITGYSRFAKEAVVNETNAGKTRTTTTSYDEAGRVRQAAITSDDGEVPLSATVTAYDTATGLVAETTAGLVKITRGYDLLGRLVTYTDADGGTTTTEHDRYGRLSRVVDPTGTTAYGYDRAKEPRGMVTTVDDSAVGVFAAGYSPDGQLTAVKYPGGITRTDSLDANLTPVARAYTRDSDGSTIYAETVTKTAHSQVATSSSTGGRSQVFGYDQRGRLSRAAQVDSASRCTTRGYEYAGTAGERTNRTALKTWQPGAAGACDDTSVPSAVTYTYDTADRLVSDSAGAYTYDAFGRVTGLPGGTTNTYHVNDLVAGQTRGDSRATWTLDPANRLRSVVTESPSGTATKVNHYGTDSDKPRWITEVGGWTRQVSGPDGDLAASKAQNGAKSLSGTNLHGDIVFTAEVDNPAAVTFHDYEEFGRRTLGDSGAYGWLGGKQRSADTVDGAILMGVRLYSPSLGRFLQTDPVAGGSCNAYDYGCGDPVNQFDLDGRKCRKGFGWVCKGWQGSARVQSWAIGKSAEWGVQRLGGRCTTEHGLRVCRSPYRVYGGGGTQYGDTFVTSKSSGKVSARLAGHEKIHRDRQWRRYGALFGVMYLYELARTGGDGRRNRWEREAGLREGGY